MHGPTEQPHSRVRGEWHWVLQCMTVESKQYIYLIEIAYHAKKKVTLLVLPAGQVLHFPR